MSTGAVLKNCVSESKQKRRENREGKRKYTMKKRAVSEKKKRVFLYLSCISKCCNIYLI